MSVVDIHEMYGVPGDLESLPDILELDILDLSDRRLIVCCVDHDPSAILVVSRSFFITSKDDVPCQKTNFGTHLD
jgi:hypothetical protein